MPVLVDLFSVSRCMAFREFSGAISYCVIYKYTYTNINILNNTMSFTFIYVENLITGMVSNKVLVIKWINYTSHIQQLYKLHPINTTFTLSGMTTVELSSFYSHSSSRLLLSAFSSSPSATTTTSSSPSTISSPASSISALSSSTACITPCVVWGLQQPSCPRQL